MKWRIAMLLGISRGGWDNFLLSRVFDRLQVKFVKVFPRDTVMRRLTDPSCTATFETGSGLLPENGFSPSFAAQRFFLLFFWSLLISQVFAFLFKGGETMTRGGSQSAGDAREYWGEYSRSLERCWRN